MGALKTKLKPIHDAAYDLDMSALEAHAVEYDTRNPLNQYGLANGCAIFFRHSTARVPVAELESLLLSCGYNPAAASVYVSQLDPFGLGTVAFEDLVQLYTTRLQRELEELREFAMQDDIDANREAQQSPSDHLKRMYELASKKQYVLLRHPASTMDPSFKSRLRAKGRGIGLFGTPLHFACVRIATTPAERQLQRVVVRFLLGNGAGLLPARAEEGGALVSARTLAETNGNLHLLPLLDGERVHRKERRLEVSSQLQDLIFPEVCLSEDVIGIEYPVPPDLRLTREQRRRLREAH